MFNVRFGLLCLLVFGFACESHVYAWGGLLDRGETISILSRSGPAYDDNTIELALGDELESKVYAIKHIVLVLDELSPITRNIFVDSLRAPQEFLKDNFSFSIYNQTYKLDVRVKFFGSQVVFETQISEKKEGKSSSCWKTLVSFNDTEYHSTFAGKGDLQTHIEKHLCKCFGVTFKVV